MCWCAWCVLPAGQHEEVQQEQAGVLQHPDQPLLRDSWNCLWCRHHHLLWHRPKSQHGRPHSGVVWQNRTLQGYTHLQVILLIQGYMWSVFLSSSTHHCKRYNFYLDCGASWSYFLLPRLESGNSIEEKLLKNGTKDLIREVAAQGTDYTLAFLTQVRWACCSFVLKLTAYFYFLLKATFILLFYYLCVCHRLLIDIRSLDWERFI